MTKPTPQPHTKRKNACTCGWRGDYRQLLRAPDPFNVGDELVACPKCRQQDRIYVVCEADRCLREASCGGIFADGVYRHTCYEHAEWAHTMEDR